MVLRLPVLITNVYEPAMIISRLRNYDATWVIKHPYDFAKYYRFDNTPGDVDSNRITTVGDDTFTVGNWWNADGQGIAYCWSEVPLVYLGVQASMGCQRRWLTQSPLGKEGGF